MVGGGAGERPGSGAVGGAAEGEVGGLQAEGEFVPDGAVGTAEGDSFAGGADTEQGVRLGETGGLIAPNQEPGAWGEGSAGGESERECGDGIVRECGAGEGDGGERGIEEFDVIRETIADGDGVLVGGEDFVEHHGTGSGPGALGLKEEARGESESEGENEREGRGEGTGVGGGWARVGEWGWGGSAHGRRKGGMG